MKHIQLILLTFIFGFLTACGGSDDSGGAPADPNAPVLNAIGDKTVSVNQLLTITPSATAANIGDTLTFTASSVGSPDIFSQTYTNPPMFDMVTGILAWTPTSANVGVHSIQFTVTDDTMQALSDSEIINITVTDSTAVASGLALYNANCANCHGFGQNSEKKAAIAADISDAIARGDGGMDSINLSATNIDDIVAYLMSL